MLLGKLFTYGLIGLILLPGPVCGQTLNDARAAIRIRDYEMATNIYERLARSGDSEAAYQLAAMYRVGRGVERDTERANEWMLHAAEAGDVRAQYSMGQLLLSKGGDQAKAREWFEKAASQNHDMAAEALNVLNQPIEPANRGVTTRQRKKALNQAIRQGDVETVRSLLGATGVDEHGVTEQRTPLLEAITAGHAEIVEILLQGGLDPNGTTSEFLSSGRVIPLHCAVRSDNPVIVSMLLAAGADVEGRDEAGNTALIVAASSGKDEMVLALLAGGANVSSADNREWTALTAARQKNHPETEQILLAHGARDPMNKHDARYPEEIDLTDTVEGQAGWTALMYAAWRGEADDVREILKTGPDVNATDADGHTALSRAAWRGHFEITRLLLDAGSDPNSRQNDGYTPLLWATQYGHLEVIRALVAEQASLYDHLPVTGYSALLLACSRQDRDTVDLLLALGTDVNWRSPIGQTALMISAAGKSSELLRDVITAGADPDVKDNQGQGAVGYAIISGRHQNLSILLDTGAKIENSDSENQHLLIQAIRRDDVAGVQTLFRYGIEPDVLSSSGNSALNVAVATGNTQIIRLLLEAGADPDFQNAQGHSALMRAAITDQPDAVVLLLEADANTRLVDGQHKTAKDWAEENGHVKIFIMLEQHRSR